MYTFYYPYYPYGKDYAYGYDYPYNNYYNKFDYFYYTYAKVCHVVMEELQVPYQAKMVYYKDGMNSEYAQYSPEGQMPMLQFENNKFYDSMAILDYFFNKYPNNKFMPTTYPNRYYAYQSMMYMNTYVYPMYCDIFTAKKYYKDSTMYTQVQETSRNRLYAYYDKMEQYFATNKFYAGDFFSVADVMFAVMAEFAQYAGFKYTFGANTQRYLNSVYAMPSYKKVTEYQMQQAESFAKAA